MFLNLLAGVMSFPSQWSLGPVFTSRSDAETKFQVAKHQSWLQYTRRHFIQYLARCHSPLDESHSLDPTLFLQEQYITPNLSSPTTKLYTSNLLNISKPYSYSRSDNRGTLGTGLCLHSQMTPLLSILSRKIHCRYFHVKSRFPWSFPLISVNQSLKA